jgi:hypothetical protein
MSYITWLKGMFARRSKTTPATLRKRPSPVKLEFLEDRTVPAAAFDSSFHAVASLPPSRAAHMMETASGPVQVHANNDAAAVGLQKTHVTFGGVELSPDAIKVRPYRGAR